MCVCVFLCSYSRVFDVIRRAWFQPVLKLHTFFLHVLASVVANITGDFAFLSMVESLVIHRQIDRIR